MKDLLTAAYLRQHGKELLDQGLLTEQAYGRYLHQIEVMQELHIINDEVKTNETNKMEESQLPSTALLHDDYSF